MEFGFNIPGLGPLAKPDSLITLARRGEEMGFDFLGVTDHIIIPRRIAPNYPYSEGGEYYGGAAKDYLEMLVTLSFLASQTSRMRLLTSALILPYRSPVVTAKMLATIDVLTKGRLIVGCGIGWMPEEFVALGSPPFEERGAVGDEYLRAFKELWTSNNPTFNGRYCQFSNIDFLPRPVQKPHPPIWVGGESPPALRRAGRLGNVWWPVSSNPRFPIGTAQVLSEYWARVRQHAKDAGRGPKEVGLAYSCSWYREGKAEVLPDGKRRTFTGTPAQIASDINAFREAGVGHLLLNFQPNWQRDSLDETLGRMERFATKVKPLVES